MSLRWFKRIATILFACSLFNNACSITKLDDGNLSRSETPVAGQVHVNTAANDKAESNTDAPETVVMPSMIAGAFLTCGLKGDLYGALCKITNHVGEKLSYNEDPLKPVVKLSTNNNTPFDSYTVNFLDDSSDWTMELNFEVSLGNTYFISVTLPGYEEIMEVALDATDLETTLTSIIDQTASSTIPLNLINNGSFEQTPPTGWRVDWVDKQNWVDFNTDNKFNNQNSPCSGQSEIEIGKYNDSRFLPVKMIEAIPEEKKTESFTELSTQCESDGEPNSNAAIKITQTIEDLNESNFYMLKFATVGRYITNVPQGEKPFVDQSTAFQAKFGKKYPVEERTNAGGKWKTRCFIFRADLSLAEINTEKDDGTLKADLIFAETGTNNGNGTLLDNVELFELGKGLKDNKIEIPIDCQLKL